VFRENQQHRQASLLDSTNWMNPRIRQKLDKSWAPIFYEYVFRKIDERPFAVLYGTTGNPNFPVNILLSLEYIKHMKYCSDLELLDSFYFDYLVNYAVGIRTLGELNLAERTLYYFRERIYQYSIDHPGEEDILFQPFLELTEGFAREAGISLAEQRADTTMFMSNIKKAGRLSLCFDILVKAVRAIPENLRPVNLSQVLEPTFKTDILYRSKAQEGDSKLAVLLNLCREALVHLEALPEDEAQAEVLLVRRFLQEQAVSDSETGKLRPKENKEIKSGSLQSAYDQEATYRKKADVSQSGYVLEISETCARENPFQLLTDYTVAPNNTSDQEILSNRLPKLEKTGCEDLYVDGGFHSEEVNQIAANNEIQIHLTNMSGTRPTKKIDVTAFAIDEQTQIIQRCPAGQIPTHAGVNNSQTNAHFALGTCDHCEYRDICHSTRQKKDFVVRISLNAVKVGRERAEMKIDQKENTSKRAAIEGSNSALKRQGQDKLPVRGQIKSLVYSAYKVTAQNIKRFVRYKHGGYEPKKQDSYPQTIAKQGILIPNFG